MDNTERILNEIGKVNSTLTLIQVDHGKLASANEEQHKSMNAIITDLSEKIGDQNGRVKALEIFKTVILTKIKVIPATISAVFGAVFGAVTVAITMYLKTKG